MAVTRDDVARLAGVSPATVSYVINNGPRPVSDETRKKVLWAVGQLSYHPSTIARSLKTNKTRTVGIVISDIQNPLLGAIAKNVQDLLFEQDYSLTVCDSDESPDRELLWLRMLISRRMDGIILLPTGGNRPLLFSLAGLGWKLVLIDREIDGIGADCVLFDNEAASYEAVSHLIGLGHSRIGLLGLPSSLTPGRGRLAGYQRAMRDAGLVVDPHCITEGSFKAQEGYVLAGRLLDVRPRLTALFACSNGLARGALQQVRERGLRMPDDLAVCVFDDVDYYALTTPSITAISSDAREFSRTAVEFLIGRMLGTYGGESRTELVPYRLQVRESTVGSGSRA